MLVDQNLQYKKEVEMMLDIARSYIQSKTSSNTDNPLPLPAAAQESR